MEQNDVIAAVLSLWLCRRLFCLCNSVSLLRGFGCFRTLTEMGGECRIERGGKRERERVFAAGVVRCGFAGAERSDSSAEQLQYTTHGKTLYLLSV